MEPALALARQLVEVADRQDDTTYRLVGYRLLGTMQLLWDRTVKRWKVSNEPSNTAIPAGKGYSAIGLEAIPTSLFLASRYGRWSFLGLHDQAARVREQVRAELSNHKHASTVAVVPSSRVCGRSF